MQAFVGIDVGKTSIRAGVFRAGMESVERWSVPSSDVGVACDALVERVRSFKRQYPLDGVGISTFGPLDIDREQRTYGAIPESSDAAWSGVNVPALVSSALGQDVFFDYDVNAGALAERTVGAARGLSSFVYLSVGTGIGGVVFRGGLVPGYAPQLGHMYLPREPDDGDFKGSCRFHGGCLQGLASGRALLERWGDSGQNLSPAHPAWDLEARYLARACANLVYTFSPEKIVIGSSVSSVERLIDRTNGHLVPLLNGFLEPELRRLYAAEPPVTRATLTPDSSWIGAAIMARDAAGLRFGR